MSPPAATYMRPGAGLYYIKVAGTSALARHRYHIHLVRSLLDEAHQGTLIPLQYRSFTSIQMVHTHSPPRRGRWNENESEMTMKMKWTLPNQDAKRGTQKKRGQREHQHDTPGLERATPKRQGKRKAEADGQRNKTSGGGGKDGSAWTNLTQRKPTPTSARAGPNLPEEGRTQEHVRKGTHGGQVDEDASTCHARFVIRLKGPRLSCQNPLDSLRVQPLNYVHNWTSPTTIKRKRNHT